MNDPANRVAVSNRVRSFGCALAVVAATFICIPHLNGQDLLIRGGHILTCAGDELSGGSILIRDGKIQGVGKSVKDVDGVPVLDATGQYVMPAFVVASSSQALGRTANEVAPVTPFVSVVDTMDPTARFIEDSYRDGHYTIHLLPGDRTVVGGTGAFVNPYGRRVNDIAFVRDATMKLSMVPIRGNRASHLAQLRKALDDGRRFLEKKERKAEDQEPTGNVALDLEAMGVERRQMSMSRLLKGDIVAFIACATAGDCVQAVRLAEEFSLKYRLVCGPGTWRAAEWLAEKNIPVILTGNFERDEKDPRTGKDIHRVIPRIFKDAGVRFAVTQDSGNLGGRYMWYRAAALVRYGFSRQEALATVTTIPAELLGLGERKGALKVGMDADVLILTDDPFSGLAWVDRGILGGKMIYDRAEDPRLQDVFGTGEK